MDQNHVNSEAMSDQLPVSLPFLLDLQRTENAALWAQHQTYQQQKLARDPRRNLQQPSVYAQEPHSYDYPLGYFLRGDAYFTK